MGGEFPVPRSRLPRITVTPQEHAARRAQMERILAQALDEYDHFRDVELGRMDPQRWKLVGTRENTRLFRERAVGSGGSVSLAPTASLSNSDHSGENDDDAADFDVDEISHFKRRLKSMRMVGELTGQMENAVYAVLTKSQEELAMVQMFLHEGVSDSQLLYTMEGPTEEQPYHFLGYKWFVKRSPGGGRLVKHRDTVYLERVGITRNKRGEEIGFLLVESVELPSFPEMPERNCIRSLQSFQFLVRQKSDNVVELFMTAFVEPSGRILKPLTTILTADTVLVVTRVMALAETRRLTKMIVAHRQQRDDLLYTRKQKATTCGLCHQRTRFFSTSSLLDCSICGQLVCSRCRTYKHVFVSDRLLGRLQRIDCCKTCLLAATRTRPAQEKAPIYVSIASQFDFQSTSRHHSRPRSSSDSSFSDAVSIRTNVTDDAALASVPLPARSRVEDTDTFHSTLPAPPISHLPVVGPVRPATAYERRRRDSTSAMNPLPVIRTPPQPEPSFTASAPAGSYDLRRLQASAAPEPVPALVSVPAPAPVRQQQDLYSQMMELRRVAESTYHTARQNHLFMEQAMQEQRKTPRPTPARHLY